MNPSATESAIVPIHDFTRKLLQPASRPVLLDYLQWRRAVRAAADSGQPAPPLPDSGPLSINLDLTTGTKGNPKGRAVHPEFIGPCALDVLFDQDWNHGESNQFLTIGRRERGRRRLRQLSIEGRPDYDEFRRLDLLLECPRRTSAGVCGGRCRDPQRQRDQHRDR